MVKNFSPVSMADSIIRRHVHSRDGYIALLEFNGMSVAWNSSVRRPKKAKNRSVVDSRCRMAFLGFNKIFPSSN